MEYMTEYKRWLENAREDGIKEILEGYDEARIEDAFYRNLAFGTGGLRGIIGAGTNRMNVYTVAKASQGLADYLNAQYLNAQYPNAHHLNAHHLNAHYVNAHYEQPSVVIGYDSRIKSDVFAKKAADVLAANGVKVYMWNRLLPVPTVSYGVRYLHASAGVMITASHNPARYNGYKVYGSDGCQITTEAAAEIFSCIEALDIFKDIKDKSSAAGLISSGAKDASNTAGLMRGSIEPVPEEVFDAFLSEIKKQSVLFGDGINKNVAVVYSPLNGTGLEPVARVLNEEGFTNITLVEEQRLPDGNFPTCPYPNPEIREALGLGLQYCRRYNADLMLATDPDCDRVGIAVKDDKGEYVLLSGNETGMLLLDYICAQRKRHGKMPADPVMLKTIVTTDIGERIAADYGVRTVDVLTGFKFIGEQIGLLEKQGREESFIFGFEESYGYLSGGYVRDKDAVGGAYLICEMFAYYKTRGISLLDKLKELYDRYGYCLNTLHSYEFEGSAGMEKMAEIMRKFREEVGEGYLFTGKKINTVLDYSKGLEGLPKSDVLKYLLDGDCSVVVRPSGTEPKLKTYISVSAGSRADAETIEAEIAGELNRLLK